MHGFLNNGAYEFNLAPCGPPPPSISASYNARGSVHDCIQGLGFRLHVGFRALHSGFRVRVDEACTTDGAGLVIHETGPGARHSLAFYGLGFSHVEFRVPLNPWSLREQDQARGDSAVLVKRLEDQIKSLQREISLPQDGLAQLQPKPDGSSPSP